MNPAGCGDDEVDHDWGCPIHLPPRVRGDPEAIGYIGCGIQRIEEAFVASAVYDLGRIDSNVLRERGNSEHSSAIVTNLQECDSGCDYF